MALCLTTAADDHGRRLDRVLRKALRDLPLSAIHRLLRKGAVLVDGKAAGADYRILAGQTITVDKMEVISKTVPGKKANISGGKTQEPEILFEGEELLVINKPAGIPVHGMRAANSKSCETLEELVRAYLEPKLPPSLSFRPGPLHRLDRYSSGIIVFSKNLEGARIFSALMRERRIKKYYLAPVEGVIEKDEIWEDALTRDHRQKKTFLREASQNEKPGPNEANRAQTALTKVSPILGSRAYTLILAEIETGRTHQIRAQSAARGHPLLGDKKYGARSGKEIPVSSGSFLLHAWRMEFPLGVPLPVKIEAPLPERFRKTLEELFGESFLKWLSRS